MLDFTKLAGQIPGISQHLSQEATVNYQRLERARVLLAKTQEKQTELICLHEKWQNRLIFSAAVPLESLETCVDLQPAPSGHSVFATDGSQIAPSHHEIAYCYLINVGRVMLHYGQGLLPLLDSVPEVFYKSEDLYLSKQWGIRTEEWMGHRRTVSEAQALTEMACRWVRPPGPHREPNVALVDGSLIYWFLEGLPLEAREQILPPILAAWEELRQTRIPLVGYLSASRSLETLNFLRLAACPHPTPDCPVHCLDRDRPPCQVTEPLRDVALWGSLLKPGQRGPLWRSSARILDSYPDPLKIYFCYIHVGTEIARLDLPAWVAEDNTLFEQTLSLILSQVHKGYGYPVALAEAHNQAVVRGGDRARFFALLEDQMIRAGLRNVGTSYKETRKRGSIA